MSVVTVPVMDTHAANVPSDAVSPTAFAAADTVLVDASAKHLKLMFVCGTTAGNAVINAGDTDWATNDLTLALTASKATAIHVDSMFYENVSGDYAGKIKITPAVAGTMYAVAE